MLYSYDNKNLKIDNKGIMSNLSTSVSLKKREIPFVFSGLSLFTPIKSCTNSCLEANIKLRAEIKSEIYDELKKELCELSIRESQNFGKNF